MFSIFTITFYDLFRHICLSPDSPVSHMKQVLITHVVLSGQRRFPNAQRPVHLHPVGQLLRQVIREKRALARNSRVAFVCPKTREERAQERDGPVQDEGVGRATVGPQDQR